MTILNDPEGTEAANLHAIADFRDRRVLEIGCGDGRLTWRYAGEAASVTAIDPNPDDIEAAVAATRSSMKDRVSFLQATIEDFASSFTGREFEIALFSWSL